MLVFVRMTSCIYPKSDVRVCPVICLFAEIAVACGHFSAALHLCVEPGEDPDKQAFSKWDSNSIGPRPVSHVLKVNAPEH